MATIMKTSMKDQVYEVIKDKIFKAVSYTHLDVYKRQPLHRVVNIRGNQAGGGRDKICPSLQRREHYAFPFKFFL